MHTMTSFFLAMRLNGIKLSPLFSFPGFVFSMITIDVLHCLDLGVSQVVLKNIFYEFWECGLSRGKNRGLKTLDLWQLIKIEFK